MPWIVCLLLFGQAAAAGGAARLEGTLAAGTPFATPYVLQDSGAAGPTVMVIGGIHGDEPAGAAAAELIQSWPILRGRLLVLPGANRPAMKETRRRSPGGEESLGDLNRNFPRSGQREPPRGTPAVEIWDLVQRQKVSWLVDLHESRSFRHSTVGAVGNTILASPRPEVDKVMPLLLAAINETIPEQEKRFCCPRAPRDGSLARAAAEQLGIGAILPETTRAGEQPLELRVRQHCVVVRRLLVHLEMIDPAIALDRLTARGGYLPAPAE